MELNSDPDKIAHALKWITTLLNENDTPYQIVGGLAAQAYGAQRPLVDIDLYAPLDQAQDALQGMRNYIVRPPSHHLSASWNLVYMALSYEDTPIEIGDSSTDPMFYNVLDQRWEPQIIDYDLSEEVVLYGVKAAVMPKNELIRYKRMLDREVDHMDIQQISRIS